MITKEEKLRKMKLSRYFVLTSLIIFISTLLSVIIYLFVNYYLEIFHVIFWSIIGVLTIVFLGRFSYDMEILHKEMIENNNGWQKDHRINNAFNSFLFGSIIILSLFVFYFYYLYGFNFMSIFLLIIITKHLVIIAYFSFDSKNKINLEYKTYNDVGFDQSHNNIDDLFSENNISFTKKKYDYSIWSTNKPIDFEYKLSGNIILTIFFPIKNKNLLIKNLNCILKLNPETNYSNSDLQRYKMLLNEALEN